MHGPRRATREVFERGTMQKGDALDLLASLPDACSPLAFFDPQFRAVLDALNEQVNRLTEVPEIAEPANNEQPSEAWDRQGSADEPLGTSPNGPHADSGKLGHRQ